MRPPGDLELRSTGHETTLRPGVEINRRWKKKEGHIHGDFVMPVS
jgi:hypothetical protein